MANPSSAQQGIFHTATQSSPPIIRFLSPSRGPCTGGFETRIHGARFEPRDYSVQIRNHVVKARYENPSTLVFTMPQANPVEIIRVPVVLLGPFNPSIGLAAQEISGMACLIFEYECEGDKYFDYVKYYNYQ